MALFLMNAVAGRVWCGYLCPQTVWTDLFQTIERWVEGDRREHLLRDQQPWTVERAGAHGAQAFPLADGRVVDRRRLGALFRRRADPGEGARDLPGAVHRLCLDRHSHLHDLCARRPHARAGLSLYVPVAAHPGRAHRRARAQRHLSLRPRRAARLGQEERGAARAGPARGRLHRLLSVRLRLPDRRRHPQRARSRLHPVRAVHRRLRHRDGEDRPPAAADRLRHRHQHQAPAGAASRRCYQIVRLRTVLYAAIIALVGAIMLYTLATRSSEGDQRHPRPQSDVRAAVRRRTPQRLHRADPQQVARDRGASC